MDTGHTGSLGRWLLPAGLVLGGALSAPVWVNEAPNSPAWAQTTINPAATPTPPPNSGLREHIEEVRDEPSEEVAVPVDDPGTRIRPASELPTLERNLPPPEPNVDRPPSVPELSSRARLRLFSTPEYRARLTELQHCRNEVALDRKVRPETVTAQGLLLRWTMDIEGRPQDVEVVAVAPTDPDVMTCVHRKLSAWQESAPPEDPYRVSHRLTFR